MALYIKVYCGCEHLELVQWISYYVPIGFINVEYKSMHLECIYTINLWSIIVSCWQPCLGAKLKNDEGFCLFVFPHHKEMKMAIRD